MSAIETLTTYLSYPFVQHALVAGLLIALCSSLLGVTLVLKRLSLIGDGLSHVAFSMLALATVLKLTAPMLFVLPVTVLCAIGLLCAGQNARIRGDASIAMLSVGSLAIGYLALNLFGPSANLSGDVCSTLFGSTSILTLSTLDVWLCAGFSLAVVLFFVLFYERLFAITFDETFARAAGLRVRACNLLLAAVVAVIIVLSMNLVGSLLISALIVFPALAAMRLCGSFIGVTICAAILSVICALIGLFTAIMAGTPVGSTIVAADMLAFLLCALLGAIVRRWRLRRTASVAACCLLLLLTGCGGKEKAPAATATPTQQNAAIDLDLTQANSTMRYAQVLYMTQKPADYAGLKIKLRATCVVKKSTKTMQKVYYCNVSDSTGCCAVMLPFQPTASATAPWNNSIVTVTGTLAVEDGEDGKPVAVIQHAAVE